MNLVKITRMCTQDGIPSSELDKLDEDAWRPLLATYRMIILALEKEAQEHGLPRREFEIMEHLSSADGLRMRMVDLANLTGRSKSGICRIVDQMQASGLVRRNICEFDRRGVYVILAEGGEEAIARFRPFYAKFVRHNFTDLAPHYPHEPLGRAIRHLRELHRSDSPIPEET
ncbi:MarR family winged helix-turn-helix transcriptional regulator [Streptomyces sp. NPDC051577]|uniref:MarR family winged helix-turn-helix transcriptional regulator n=1 Tax=Streptomyces sp. NPDC051577 TaxID=3155166 RepID=UPI00341EDFA3